ncbi:MAG: hypothetical protein RLY40_1007 [Pseudomonadota bacterium]|jgi:hypothetical protein
MKLKTKMHKATEKALKSIPDIYSFKIYPEFFKPEGEIITQSIDKGYFKVDINDSETRIKINFQLLPYDDIIINL